MTIILPMNRNDVKAYLPHRDPILFIDRVIAVSEQSIKIESDIRPEADFFKGHFPHRPIMPGVLIAETVAQAGALLVSISKGISEGKFIAFTHMDNVKFRRPVKPNETLSVDVEIVKVRRSFYRFSGIARVEEDVAASLDFGATLMDFGTETNDD